MNITQILDACTGCGVCAAVCPSAAVRMQPDAHGFLRPVVDDAACTDCGLCTRKCPVSVLPQNSAHTDVLTGYAKDGTLLPRSSSGAIFPVLAAEIIRRGGLVFGAAFDGQFQVVHTAAESVEELSALCSSKYVQGRIPSDCYAQVKAALAAGRWVYFSGMPCQVAALKSYLGRDYDTLITQDTACHSVPSPLVWEGYKAELEKQHSGKLTSFSFRNKANGWEASIFAPRLITVESSPSPLPKAPISAVLSRDCTPAAPALYASSKGSSVAATSRCPIIGVSRESSRTPTTRRAHPLFCCIVKRDAACWKAARISCNSSPQPKTRLPLTRRCLHPFKSPSATMNSGKTTVKRPLPIWFPPAASRQRTNWQKNDGTEVCWHVQFAN